jgi:hypothetical protein
MSFFELDIHLNDNYVNVSWSLCMIKHHFIEACGGEEVEFHASIISTLDESE